MDDILQKVDRATMSQSIEGREPLLDYRLIDKVVPLKSSLKLNHVDMKIMLKEICHKYIPKKLVDRSKMGFTPSLETYFKLHLKQKCYEVLSDENLESNTYINAEFVKK